LRDVSRVPQRDIKNDTTVLRKSEESQHQICELGSLVSYLREQTSLSDTESETSGDESSETRYSTPVDEENVKKVSSEAGKVVRSWRKADVHQSHDD